MDEINHKTVKDIVSAIETNDINTRIISSAIKSALQTVIDKKVCEEAPETPDSQCEVISKFEKYVKRIRSKVYTRELWRKEQLFHCCLIVGLNRRTPYIKEKFPEHVSTHGTTSVQYIFHVGYLPHRFILFY